MLIACVAVALAAGACGSTKSHQPQSQSVGTTGAGSGSTHRPSPFAVEATYTAKSLGLTKPANLAIGPDGNVYVTDAQQRVTVVSPDGKVIRRWGTPGNGAGQFHFVQHDNAVPGVAGGIAVASDGRVYVADSGNARVESFSPSGRFLSSFGSSGQADGRFVFPQYLVMDSDGNAYVPDDVKETLAKFAPTGTLQWEVGGANEKNPDLVGHLHVSSSSVDAHGRIVVVNDDRGRVVYLDSHGNEVDAFGEASDFIDGACDASIDPAGYVFVNSCQEPLESPHYTAVFDRSHHLVATWDPSPLGWSPRFGPGGETFGLTEDGSIVRLRLNVDEG